MKHAAHTSQMGLCLQRLRLPLLSATVGATCLAALLVLLTLPALAQPTIPPVVEQGSFPIRRPFGTGTDQTVALGIGDMDGDGDLDIVAGNRGEASSIAHNDGAGYFPLDQLRVFGAAADTTDLAVGDLDGDGDLDVVLSAGDGSASRYLNDGRGNLAQGELVMAGLGAGNESKVALGDMNGDGAFDIVLTRRQGETLILENDRSARFPITQTLGISSAGAVNLMLGDLDGKGLLDVVLAPNTGPATIFYQNNRAFTQTLTLTATNSSGEDITAGQGIRDITLGDFDGDQRLDVLTTLAGMNSQDHHILYLNNQDRNIVQSSIFGKEKGSGDLWSVASGDLNGDGALDLVIGIGTPGWLNKIWLNGGDGQFSEEQTFDYGPKSQKTYAVAIADLDNDGLPDIINGNYGIQNSIHLNGKGMRFMTKNLHSVLLAPREARQFSSVAAGDVNGDGLLDIVAGVTRETRDDEISTAKTLLVNQGDGRFCLERFGSPQDSVEALALADFNKDGALDVISTDPISDRIALYLNDRSGRFPDELNYSIPDLTSLATGDLDNKNGIDLVACSQIKGCTVLLNNGTGDHPFSDKFAVGLNDRTHAVALVDINTDGQLDIIAGNQRTWNYIYLNDGTGQFSSDSRKPFGSGSDYTQALAVTDVNGDGKPDILVGDFYGLGTIYINDGEGNFPPTLTRSFGRASDRIYGIAVGDINSDGAMDFVTGNWGTSENPSPNFLYLNDGLGNFISTQLPADPNWTKTIIFADMDSNGALDIVEGNRFSSHRQYLLVHLNRLRIPIGLVADTTAITITCPVCPTQSKQLPQSELAFTNHVTFAFTLKDRESEKVGRVLIDYSLDGGGYWLPAQISHTGALEHLQTSPDGSTYQFVWDVGASGVMGRSDNVVLRARAYGQPAQPAGQGVYSYTNTTPSLNQWAYASATTPPFSVRGMQISVQRSAPAISNTFPVSNALVYQLLADKERGALPLGGVATPFRTAAGGLLPGRGQLQLSDRLVALWPTAAVTATTPVRLYASRDAFPLSGSSLDSRLIVSDARRIGAISVWVDISATQPVTLHLATPRKERVALASNLLPASNADCNDIQQDVLNDVRQMAEVEPPCGGRARVVFTPTLAAPANPFADGAWTLELRAASGLTGSAQLLGWGMALTLSPLHFTSAAPLIGGLDAHTVENRGVQTLTVRSTNPLLLFDLDVALEWNAVNDERYQAQLSADLRRASELLYDWSNGQIALGNVTIYHDGRRNTMPDGSNAWNNAHIRIYANNRLRPNADQGGVISQEMTETVAISHETRLRSYLPGQVRMGATWNRYGDANSGNIGDDWPAALAHELGHYLLFLDDNYLTLKDNFLIPLTDDDCQGAMNNPYSNVYSEFHPAQGWDSSRCAQTLSEQNVGRADWETITRFYPWLQPPTGVFSQVLPGPSLLPLAVTQLSFRSPDSTSDPMTWMQQIYGRPGESAKDVYYRLCTPRDDAIDRADLAKAMIEAGGELSFECTTALTSTQPLETPIFYIKGGTAESADASQMRAFLFRGLPYPALVDLGQPIGDQVVAPGARPDDRLCVYDLPNQRVGCKKVTPGDDQLVMEHNEGWQPQIVITPESSRTLQVDVALPAEVNENHNLTLVARLYPVDGPAPAPITMTLVATGPQFVYSARITTETPVLEGYVLLGERAAGGSVGVNSRQAVVEFSIGGNPVRIRARHSPINARDVRIHARSVRIRARHAPTSSTDGQAMIYPDPENPAFGDEREWSFTLQPATRLPAELSWATPVGRAYWLAASANITDVGASSIAFDYLQSDVPPGEEAFIRMYFWEEKDPVLCPRQITPCWRLLNEQKTFPEHNLVSARLAGPGLYALFSHIDIPLQPGWNLIGYPIQGRRLITEALASIAGRYSMVYGSAVTPSGEDTNVYLPDAEQWVSDLKELQFGHGYWINITESVQITGAVVLRLKGATSITETPMTTFSSALIANPPAIYYGKLTDNPSGVEGEPARRISAYVEEELCGEGVVDGSGRYVVKVRASSAAESRCGAAGRHVFLVIDGVPVAERIWEGATPVQLDLPVTSQPLEGPPAAQIATVEQQASTLSGCQQIVRNGDFEADGDWVRVITGSRGRLLEVDEAHGRSLVLGVRPGEPAPRALVYSTGYQEDLLLPRAAASITLSFDVQTDDNEGSQGRRVRIYRADWVGRPLASFAMENSAEWRRVSLDLTPYQGRSVNLYYEATNGRGDAARWMAVDNVTIQVCN